jgi:hypothetical protein
MADGRNSEPATRRNGLIKAGADVKEIYQLGANVLVAKGAEFGEKLIPRLQEDLSKDKGEAVELLESSAALRS